MQFYPQLEGEATNKIDAIIKGKHKARRQRDNWKERALELVNENNKLKGDHRKMMGELAYDLVEYLSDDEKRNVYHIEKFIRNWKPKQ